MAHRVTISLSVISRHPLFFAGYDELGAEPMGENQMRDCTVASFPVKGAWQTNKELPFQKQYLTFELPPIMAENDG